MRKLIVVTGLVAALAGGSIADAAGHGKDRARGPGADGNGKRQGKNRGGEKGKREDRGSRGESRRAKRCAKPRRVGFVVKGTFVSADEGSVTLKVLRANRHALRSGLVTIGEEYTATPTKPGAIRYVNRDGAEDAQTTDRVKATGKLSVLRRKCSSDDVTPTVAIRKVRVIAPDAAEDTETDTEVSGS